MAASASTEEYQKQKGENSGYDRIVNAGSVAVVILLLSF